MGIRNRLIEVIGGKEWQDEQRKLRASVDYLVDAWQYQADPVQVIEQLKEYDSAALVDLVHDIEYERIGGMQSYFDSARRESQMKAAERMWINSPLAAWVVNVWTSYGMGEGIKITLDDENAQEFWDETVNRSSQLSSDVVHELSNWIVVYGNDFLVQFISTLDGTTTWELIPAEEIPEDGAIKAPGSNRVLFYKRQFVDSDGVGKTWYYPNSDEYLGENWQEEDVLPQGAIRTDEMSEKPTTVALMMHIAHNRKNPKSVWGWSVIGLAREQMLAHKEFVQNRLTVSRNKASYVREETVKGGSRAVASIRAKLNSTLSGTNAFEKNPAPTAGSELIHNEAVSVKDLSMGTGAGDAKQDNELFAWYALIGTGLFPTSAGLDTSRWATAVAMDKTQSTQWSRYQSFWANNFRRIVKLTLQAGEKYGSLTTKGYGATVSIDTLSLVDFPGIVQPISQMINSMQPFVDNGTIPGEAAKKVLQNLWFVILQSLGVSDAADITSDESFEIGLPQEAAEAWAEVRRMLFKEKHG